MIPRSLSGVVVFFMVFACLLPTPAAWAQQASGIAGAVRDTSGAVLPGVTVEAASPALIEKVRIVVTDDQGRYNIVALVPGTYTVTFTLPGFRTVRQEGVVLTAGFTATANADLAVGALEETITVTGASPLVDTQNVRTQTVVSTELLDLLPSANRSFVTFAKLTPGFVASDRGRADVGGSAGVFWGNSNSGTAFHGRGGITQHVDGMRINDLRGSNTAYVPNSASAAEMMMETSGFSAESPAAGVSMNVIPSSGGNDFSVSASSLYSNGSMQSDNLGDKVRARGVTEVEELKVVRSSSVGVGGPIKRDTLWFFTAPKWDRTYVIVGGSYFNALADGKTMPLFYSQGQRGFKQEKWRSTPVRLTWQASQKDKVNAFMDFEPFCACFRSTRPAAETNSLRIGNNRLAQVTWIRPVTNRFLVEAGVMRASANQEVPRVHSLMPNVRADDIAINDSLNGFVYNGDNRLGNNAGGDKHNHHYYTRGSVTYVTGSHTFKTGFQHLRGLRSDENLIKQSMFYTFRGSAPGAATPLSVTLLTTPYTERANINADLGIFVQDQWKVKRLTLNLGLRFDYLNMSIPAQHAPAGPFVDARDFAEVRDVPNWKDLNPRLGVAYDLFGNGRTALKGSVSRYVNLQGVDFANDLNPLTASVNTVTRDWTDANGNYVPDCALRNPAANGECGVFRNLNFGGSRITTRWADGLLKGFGVREGVWSASTEVQHQLTREASLVVSYFRSWSFNSIVTENLLVGPGDYSPFFITAPVDPRLPGGGGYRIDGLYDLNPAKVGQVETLVRPASDFGNRKQAGDFVAVNVQTRFGEGVRLGGGIDTGRIVVDNCYVVDSPELLNCRVVTSWKNQLQVKLFGSYPLPAGFSASAIFTNTPGIPLLANYTVTRAQIEGLGRPLSTTSRVVPLLRPETEYEPRNTQLDLKLANTIRMGRYTLTPNLSVYNALNGSSTNVHIEAYGPNWRPTEVLPGRLLQVSADLKF